MRIAQLLAQSGQTGAETHVIALVRGLRNTGVTCVLFCPEDGPMTETLRADGFEVRLESPRGQLRPFALGRLARALADFPLVHVHGPRATFWSALLKRTHPERPAVTTVHEFGLRHSIYRPLESWSLRQHDRVIAISRDLHRRLHDHAHVPEEKLRDVPNCSAVLLRPKVAIGPAPASPYAVVAARLERVKGVDLLLSAWAILRDKGAAFPLRVLGEGTALPALREQCNALRLDDLVRFDGFARDPVPAIGGAALYVAPSRMEGLPGSVIEAMGLGVPVVATRVGGNIDVLESAGADWLVAPEDPRAIADAVERMRALPDPDARALRASLQGEVYRRFHPDVVAGQVAAIYRELLR
jgi:glycosyltransferase involved in cell wall biosynthesis